MSETEVELRLSERPGWTCVGSRIERRFEFADFEAVMRFVNAVADVARELDHHPEVQFGFSACTVAYTTHAAGGLTTRDFAAAARVDAL